MKTIKLLTTVSCVFMLVSTSVYAKDLKGNLGVGFNSQLSPQGVDSLSAQYWINNELSVQGILGFRYSDESDEIDLGGKVHFKIKDEENLHVDVIAGIGFAQVDPDVGSSETDTWIGAGVGIEYFFSGLPNLGFSTEVGIALLDFDDRAIMTENIWGYLWGKLAYGAQLFATALTNDSIADCFANPAYQALFIAIAEEVMRVAQARDIRPEAFDGFNPHAFMPGTDPELTRQSLADLVTFNRASTKTHSGIWRDLAVRKRRTEADALLGPIVPLGAEVGVATPLIARLIDLIHDIEEDRRPQSLETLASLKDVLGNA